MIDTVTPMDPRPSIPASGIRSVSDSVAFSSISTTIVARSITTFVRSGATSSLERDRSDTSMLTPSNWSVTESGLAYGKNVTNPKNQRETAPHWYEDTFDKLLALVLGAAT